MTVVISKQVCKPFAIPLLEADGACDHPQEQKAAKRGRLTSKARAGEGHAASASLSEGTGLQVPSHLVRTPAAPGGTTGSNNGGGGRSQRGRAEEAQLLEFSQRRRHTWG